MGETTNGAAGDRELAGNEWTASLAPALRQIIEADGHKTPADLAKAYAELQRTIGADKIALPKDGAWDDAARERLGIPKEADGYKLKRPENLPPGMTYDEDFERATLPVAHNLGLTPAQLQGLLDFYSAYAIDAYKADEMARRQEGVHSTMTPADALKAARRLMPTEAYQKHDHEEHGAAVNKVASYFKIAYPES